MSKFPSELSCGENNQEPLETISNYLLYGMKFLRVLIFAIFSTIHKKKSPQKIIPRKTNFRKNLLHYWNYPDHYI